MNNIVRIVNHQESLLSSMLDIQDLYNQRVSNCASKFIKIYINPLELKYITDVATKIVAAKLSETAYKKDGASLIKRYVNGLKGEAAVAKHLGISIINPDVGVSTVFDVPDIPGYGVGIKTVDFGHFPIIPKTNTYPQIICICHPSSANVVYICGLADIDTLNKFQCDDLILDPNLKAKGSKTGFWGFMNLQDVSMETIEPFKGQEIPHDPIIEDKPVKTSKPKNITIPKVSDVDHSESVGISVLNDDEIDLEPEE